MRRALFTAACLLASAGVAATVLSPTPPGALDHDGVLVASGGAGVEVAQTTTTTMRR